MAVSANAVTPTVEAGNGSAYFLLSDSSVWQAGGNGGTSPVRLFQLSDITAIADVGSGILALRADGTLWGYGGGPMLGDGTNQFHPEPAQIPGLADIRSIASPGGGQVFAVKGDGTVWAWGSNSLGQLGDGTQTDRYTPGLVLGLTDITQVSASYNTVIARRSDGTVWVWGAAYGPLTGDGSPEPDNPSRAQLVPRQIANLDQVVSVAAAYTCFWVVRNDGSVWGWGGNRIGILGTGASASFPTQITALSNIVAVQARSAQNALALKADGSVWSWGYNNMGQLGISGPVFTSSPAQVPGLSDIVGISVGNEYALALKRDGTVFAWGSNTSGQLGDGTLHSRAEPRTVLAPGGTGQFKLSEVAPASYNQLPQAGMSITTTTGNAPLAVQVTGSGSDSDGSIKAYYWKTSDGQSATGASASFTFSNMGTYTVALLVEDDAGGTSYTLSNVTVSPPLVTGFTSAAKARIAGFSSLALTNDGRVLSWGFRRISLNSGKVNTPFSVPVDTAITGAIDITPPDYENSYVLLSDGTVLSWGGNERGGAGVGSPGTRMVGFPQPIPGLPPSQAVVEAGWQVGLALTRDGRVFSWGVNDRGQLGLGDLDDRYWATEIPGLSNVISVAGRGDSSYALKADGSVWGWGNVVNSSRPQQIQGLPGTSRIFATTYALFAQEAGGATWVVGSLPFSVTGDPGAGAGPRHLPLFDGAVEIAGGSQHVVVLKTDGTVWTGGQKNSYALGFADAENIDGLRQIPGITDAISVSAGDTSSAVLLGDGRILAWGRNFHGQIGDGTFAQRLTPVAVVNETTDGFLDLIPGTDFELPPSVGVPFFVIASGSVADVKASVSTKTRFNLGDLGKTGEVFVTATVPAGSLVPASSPMNAATLSSASVSAASKPASSAITSSNSFVLVNLTASGWQTVANGQLIPYATGVLGDQLSAQTILADTDTTNLKGAQFCLGYGASAAQMIASGTMRVVASIPDPNATEVTAPTCILAGPPVSYSLALPQGWSLLGNSLNQALAVSTLFNDMNAITSVWKWDANTLGWQFYTPLMDAIALQTYAASKGYAVLSTINPGEGYWVNAKAQPTIGTQSGDSFILTGMSLAKGWNLVATGNDITPTEFNTNLKASAVPASLKTLWAWDNPQGTWYFYAPSLEAQGGTSLSGYIANKGYLDFATTNKKLGNGAGFWVNR